MSELASKPQFSGCFRISKKLGLQKGGRLLDIGCGWGGMLIHAAKSCKEITGLGTTLSEEQCKLATKRIAAHGLQDRLEVRVCDYRDLVGSFDYVVSIGMFEHVGKPSYLTFMKKARDLLRPKGIGLLHTIAVTEDPSIETDTWIQEYIFPGGRLPRLEELATTMREAGLLIGHVENWRPHYAKTLRRWHEKFSKNKERIRALGATFNERFLRMWVNPRQTGTFILFRNLRKARMMGKLLFNFSDQKKSRQPNLTEVPWIC